MSDLNNEKRMREYSNVLGQEAGECLLLLENKLLGIHHDWLVYKGLFGTSEERVNVLNSASGLVAWTVERTMWDSIVLRLAHLGDPTSNSQETLSVDKLISVLRTDGWDEEKKAGYRTLRKYVKRLLGELEPIRNKVLAHADYDAATRGYQGIYRASRKQIDDTLDKMDELLNLVRVASGLQPVINLFVEIRVSREMSTFFEVLTAGLDTEQA